MDKEVRGITFVGALQIALILLRLFKEITWNWVWVLAPTWLEILLLGAAFIWIMRK